MNAKSFLDELLKSSKEFADKGKAFAGDKLKLPEDPDDRELAKASMKKGAILTGVLALLLGTRGGRKVTGSAIKLGSLAAVGTIGWQAYQNWKKENAQQAAEETENNQAIPINELPEKEADERSLVLLKAMIAAAKSDGHINAEEIETIQVQIKNLGLNQDVAQMLDEEISKPLNLEEIAAFADNRALASEIYLVSAAVTNRENSVERDYLDRLAKAMDLPTELVSKLEEDGPSEA